MQLLSHARHILSADNHMWLVVIVFNTTDIERFITAESFF